MSAAEFRALIAEAVTRFAFRQRGPFEGAADYLAALIAHAETRDYAAAHELRTGRRQEAWTAADVTAFRDRMMGNHHGPPRETLRPGAAVPVMQIGSIEGPLTDTAVLDIARAGLHALVAMRTADPASELAIFATVVLIDGRVLTASVDRGDRVAVLKTMAQQMPVFGFTLVCDVFIHSVPAAGQDGPAMKREAIIAHAGTRDLRVMMSRPYQVIDGRAVFDDPPPADVDKRGRETMSDPYAVIFASAAPSRTQ